MQIYCSKKNCDITVLARNMVVRKWGSASNKRMGKRSYGCGIMGIVLWNSEVTGALAVEGRISAVRRRVISVDERCKNRPKSVSQRRSMVNHSVVSRKSAYALQL